MHVYIICVWDLHVSLYAVYCWFVSQDGFVYTGYLCLIVCRSLFRPSRHLLCLLAGWYGPVNICFSCMFVYPSEGLS